MPALEYPADGRDHPCSVTRILFRCDASLSIGSGHVMRCRTLARQLRRRGADITFLCRRQSGDLISLLEQEFTVLVLPQLPLERCEGLEGTDLYRAWLGCSQQQDALDCLAALQRSGDDAADWLVLDHYGLDAGWQEAVRGGLPAAASPKLLVLDDLANRSHVADVLVDANRLTSEAEALYAPLIPDRCRLLLGPDFAPLDPVYDLLRPIAPLRRTLQRVLVFYGGVDQGNHCALALEALSHPDLAHLTVDVVLGSAAPHRHTVEQLVQRRPLTHLHRPLPSLAALMLRADLALGAAGTSSWERAALGLPTILTAVADNQQQGAAALAAAGAALLQPSTPAATTTLIERLLSLGQNPERLEAMSAAALAIGDGRGLGRLATALLGPCAPRRLRPAAQADEILYHRWANDPDVRRQSFGSDPIPLADHQAWFRRRLTSPDALLRVLVDAQDLPLGQIRFERRTAQTNRAVIGFSLDPVARGHGLAAELVSLGLSELSRLWGASAEAYGEVRSTNLASCRAFLSAGFAEGPSPRKGVRCFYAMAAGAH